MQGAKRLRMRRKRMGQEVLGELGGVRGQSMH